MEELSVDYIRGWVDRQSQVNVSGRAIVATTSTEQPMRSVCAALRRMDIDCGLAKYGDRWELRIGRRDALERFRTQIGFLCSDKSDKLDQILGSYIEAPET